MKILVAGGSGTVGIPLVRALVAAGHEVTAMTRSPGKAGELRTIGASAAIADALDRPAVMRAVADARPTHVIHQLTALPKTGVRGPQDLEPTNRLRIEGTRNLLDASIAAHARRFVVGSFAMLSSEKGSHPSTDAAAAAVRSMETQVLEATARGAIEGVILRYGLFYGPGVPSTDDMIDKIRRRRLPVVRNDAGQLPVIHIDDVVSATVLALERAPAGAVYDIVDDQAVSLTQIVDRIAEYTGSSAPLRIPAWIPRLLAPYMSRLTSMRMPLSNKKAKSELGWRPKYPTSREGIAALVQRAA